jgi:2-dehydropantoate 2-reductase
MRVAVMGAGAVGCYYGGLLARAGHEVVLIGRPQHVAAMRRQGLVMDLPSGRETVEVQADTEVAAARDAELVLVCVKSTDTEAAGEQLRQHLAAGTVVWSLQNGVDNAARLAAVLDRQVAPVVVYVATAMAADGHVVHHGRGELVVGPGADNERMAAAFDAAGVPMQISDNVAGALWMKLVLNCAWNALSAITQQPYGELARADGVPALMHDVVAECRAVAAAEGVRLPEGVDEAVRRIGETMPGQFSSTAQDLARGRRSEIDHLNGHVVRRAEAHGLSAPANRVLHTLVRLIEGTRH